MYVSLYQEGIHYCRPTPHTSSTEPVISAYRIINKLSHHQQIVLNLMRTDSSTNLIIAISRQYGLSKRRGNLSKAVNLLLKLAFSIFCHSEFVYDACSVYFT